MTKANAPQNETKLEGRFVYTDLSDEDRRQARRCAKAKGMLFQSWLGEVIRKAVKEETSAAEDDE